MWIQGQTAGLAKPGPAKTKTFAPIAKNCGSSVYKVGVPRLQQSWIYQVVTQHHDDSGAGSGTGFSVSRCSILRKFYCGFRCLSPPPPSFTFPLSQ